MTVVAIWLEPQEQTLWVVADTRISNPGQSGGTVVATDSGAKLFALPIHCYAAVTGSFAKKTLYQSSVGYAFAGDVLPATMTFATVSTFFQNLVTVGSYDPPRLRDIVEMVGHLAEGFSKEALFSSNLKYGKFSAAVFGWCPVLNQFAIYQLVPKMTASDFKIQITETIPRDNSAPVSFGTGAARLLHLIGEIHAHGDKFPRTARIPKIAAEALIAENIGDIGGSLSIGAATKEGFQLFSRVTPNELGSPEANITFNGINLGQNARLVGQYMVSITGMV